jgi:hypothetical protein
MKTKVQVLPLAALLLTLHAGCRKAERFRAIANSPKLPLTAECLTGTWEGFDTTWIAYYLIVLNRDGSGLLYDDSCAEDSKEPKAIMCWWSIDHDNALEIILEARAQTIISHFTGYMTGSREMPALKLIGHFEHGGIPIILLRIPDVNAKRGKALTSVTSRTPNADG